MGQFSADTTIGGFSIVDLIYPIGSVYETKDSNFDPGSYWGGTWARIKGKVLVGVDESDTDFATVGQTGGSKSVTLTTAQMPSHTHTFTGSAATSGTQSANHTHSGTTGGAGGHSHNIAYDKDGGSGTNRYTVHSGGVDGSQDATTTTDSVANHTHTFTTGNNSANHTHSVTAKGSNSNTGGGGAHTNLQPYCTVYIWERTA